MVAGVEEGEERGSFLSDILPARPCMPSTWMSPLGAGSSCRGIASASLTAGSAPGSKTCSDTDDAATTSSSVDCVASASCAQGMVGSARAPCITPQDSCSSVSGGRSGEPAASRPPCDAQACWRHVVDQALRARLRYLVAHISSLCAARELQRQRRRQALGLFARVSISMACCASLPSCTVGSSAVCCVLTRPPRPDLCCPPRPCLSRHAACLRCRRREIIFKSFAAAAQQRASLRRRVVGLLQRRMHATQLAALRSWWAPPVAEHAACR